MKLSSQQSKLIDQILLHEAASAVSGRNSKYEIMSRSKSYDAMLEHGEIDEDAINEHVRLSVEFEAEDLATKYVRQFDKTCKKQISESLLRTNTSFRTFSDSVDYLVEEYDPDQRASARDEVVSKIQEALIEYAGKLADIATAAKKHG